MKNHWHQDTNPAKPETVEGWTERCKTCDFNIAEVKEQCKGCYQKSYRQTKDTKAKQAKQNDILTISEHYQAIINILLKALQ